MIPGAALDALQRRLGRRGMVLLLLGTLWVVQGIALRSAPYVNDTDPTVLYEYLPVNLRCGLWVVSGIVAMTVAACFSPHRDRHGYTVLVVLPLERGFSLLWGWVMTFFPGDGGYAPGLRGAATWFAVTVIVMIVAGWPEPPAKARRAAL